MQHFSYIEFLPFPIRSFTIDFHVRLRYKKMNIYECHSNYNNPKIEDYRSVTGMISVASLCQKLIDRD